MIFNVKDIQIANATSRSRGSVGQNAITPKHVASIAKKTDKILDFGAGKDALHTMTLRKLGFNVTAHEFGSNFNNIIHSEDALAYKYDLVFASNVINVQNSENMLIETLSSINNIVNDGGKFIFNFPSSPRKGFVGEITTDELLAIVRRYFREIKIVGGSKRAPLVEAWN